ncbi:MAG: hypothetical protein Q9227_000205 [Pyrenula ochraceoflavens]
MESSAWQHSSVPWSGEVFGLAAPHISVRGRMAATLALAIFFALIWLLIRAYQVIQTPNEILAEKLGLDIPPSPEIILEEIRARDIEIAWKLQDIFNTIEGYVVQVNSDNGESHHIRLESQITRVVGTFGRTEMAASVHLLKPDTFYEIRVFAVSAAAFQTPSSTLYVRTKRLESDPSQSPDADEQKHPYARASTSRSVPPMSPLSAPSMVRESSSGQGPVKRTTTGRRLSPTGPVLSQDHTVSPPQVESETQPNEEDTTDSVNELSSTLQQRRQETDTFEAEIIRDKEEHDVTVSRLTNEKDKLKQRLKEYDEANGQLKREIHQLESKVRAATNVKARKEKTLQQKEAERQRRRDEIQRWTEEQEPMQDRLAKLEEDKLKLEDEALKEVAEIKARTEHEANRTNEIEERNKDLNRRIKILEAEQESHAGNDNTEDEHDYHQKDKTLSQYWEPRLQTSSQQVSLVRQQLAAAQQQFEIISVSLNRMRQARQSGNNPPFIPLPLDLELGRRGTQNRRARQRSSLNSNISSPTHLPLQIDTNQTVPVTNDSPTSIGALINIGNGAMNLPLSEMPLPGTQDTFVNAMPMSPKAENLLPKGLLGEDDTLEDLPAAYEVSGRDGRQSSSPTSNKRFSGHVSNPWFDGPSHDAVSPVSSLERPRSILTSPHGSIPNLAETESQPAISEESHHLQPDPVGTSLNAPRKGLSNLFSFSRQRGKTTDEPPALGSLKPAQSQSFPKDLGETLDPMGPNRRRRGSHAGPMSSFFPLNSISTDRDPNAGKLLLNRRVFPFFGAGRQNPSVLSGSSGAEDGMDQFSPRSDSLDASILSGFRPENSPSRASSIYSFGEKLPRPSNDESQQPFGWNNAEKSGLRGSPLGQGDWARPWSRNPSRRPSTQYGSTTNLPLVSHFEEAQPVHQEPSRPLQAPIGTRPSSSRAPKPATPKLNPAVPSFRPKGFFGLNKDKEKSKPPTSDPVRSSKDSDLEPSIHGVDDLSSSPPVSRRSRDAHSIATADSMAESYESLERTASSSTPSDPAPTVPSSKETLMQKLTRKSSSTKFNSWKISKDKGGVAGSGIFSREKKATEPSTPDEVDEEEGQLGRSVESAGSTLGTPDTGSEAGFKPKERSSRSSLSFGGFMKRRDRERTEKAKEKKGGGDGVDMSTDDRGTETGTEDGE